MAQKASKPKKVTAGQATAFNNLFGKLHRRTEQALRSVDDNFEGEMEVVDDGEAVERYFEIISGEITYRVTVKATRNQ